jgi:hypothetical protein
MELVAPKSTLVLHTTDVSGPWQLFFAVHPPVQ